MAQPSGDTSVTSEQVEIRPLVEGDLVEADRIMRVAFGSFIGLPDPAAFMGDASGVDTRWKASPGSAFAAELGGRLVGSSFATRWGSFGTLGPLTLDPTLWNRGFASALIEPLIATFDTWGVTQAGLYTFAESPKHIGLYQKFGFRPRSLTLVLEKTVRKGARQPQGASSYARLDARERAEMLSACRRLTDDIYPGLDATPEIESIQAQSLGDTVLVARPDLSGFAACHVGPGSEAGSGCCYIKFGAAAPNGGARANFRRLLEACEAFANAAGATHIHAGVNAARAEAYESMLSAGFRISQTGLSMHRPNEPGFSRPGVFVMDDWR
jgi:GNAT superfamily N-acetyltransferase